MKRYLQNVNSDSGVALRPHTASGVSLRPSVSCPRTGSRPYSAKSVPDNNAAIFGLTEPADDDVAEDDLDDESYRQVGTVLY